MAHTIKTAQGDIIQVENEDVVQIPEGLDNRFVAFKDGKFYTGMYIEYDFGEAEEIHEDTAYSIVNAGYNDAVNLTTRLIRTLTKRFLSNGQTAKKE